MARSIFATLSVVLVLAVFAEAEIASPSSHCDHRIPTASVDSTTDTLSAFRKADPWLMGAFALDLPTPNVGTPDNVFGVSYRAGFTWHNAIVMFAAHSAKGSFTTGQPSEEHRFDYAVETGVSLRDRAAFVYAVVGPSYVEYLVRGAELAGSKISSPSYSILSGTAFGLAASMGVYVTPFPGWGAFGISGHTSFLRKQPFWSIEISLLELNIPLVRDSVISDYPVGE